jgi:uncharacterized glyoxalase superfamily protein PhnB
MTMINQIVLTLHVTSVEETAAWYERVLGWKSHFDTFDEAGRCLFGSVMLQECPFAGFNLARSAERQDLEANSHCSSWIYVEDVDAVYGRVVEQRWPVETMPEDQFWGERLFKLRDLNGNHLVVTQQIEELELAEIRERHKEVLKAATVPGSVS